MASGRRPRACAVLVAVAVATAVVPPAMAQAPERWRDAALPPDARARLVVAAMTLEEKLALVHGHVGFPFAGRDKPDGAFGSAGFVAGIPRLGVPALQETDAGLGVANPHDVRPGDAATALPSGLATAATFEPDLAERAGAVVGAEARAKGFNVVLGPGLNLTREPRNGRNFEYAGEDPLLAGVIASAEIRGIQSNRVMATMKHFAVNDQETGRTVLDAAIDPAAARESDLRAFQFAIEQGRPHAVMCAYNRVNGAYSCENDFLLNHVLKDGWGFPGFVMSDWGAVHSAEKAALAGLDQESGEEMDAQVFFGAPLKDAVAAGRLPSDRLDDMVTRIVRSMFASGVFDDPPRPGGTVDYAAHAATAQTLAEHGIVLLRNRDGALPLPRDLPRIAVIGSHADRGVLSGGGSSQVMPVGGNAVPGLGPEGFPGPIVHDPSAPLAAIAAAAPGAHVDYDAGDDAGRAVALARDADAVVVFAHQWMAEMVDAPDLALPDGQDDLIARVAAANPHTVVVLETGGPVTMPWLADTAAVLAAWYPGAGGGEAIARILFGDVDPSGRLPMTFPLHEAQLPRPTLDAGRDGQPFAVDYDVEGARAGYQWFDTHGLKPLFPFGFGLSYATFGYRDLTADSTGGHVSVSLGVTNTGARRGAAVPQIYLRRPDDPAFPLRLAGWDKIWLDPGETRRVTMKVDLHLLAGFDPTLDGFEILPGRYAVVAGADAGDLPLTAEFSFPGPAPEAR